MANQNQKREAKDIIDTIKSGKKYNAQRSLEFIGYSKKTAKANSKKVIESKGVKEELKKAGFNVDEIDKVVNQILYKGTEQGKLKAADLGYKRLGSYAPEKREHKIEDSSLTKEERKLEIEQLLKDVRRKRKETS